MRYTAAMILTLLCLYGQSQKKATSNSEENIFHCIFPVLAEFPGGDAALRKFIMNEFNQPAEVPDSSFEKKGIVQFTISKNGKVSSCEIIDTLGYCCDEEIIRLLQLTRWKPAVYEGKRIDDHRRLPYTIIFEKSTADNPDSSTLPAPYATIKNASGEIEMIKQN
ncbi:energy transducer TonB [Ferruginibacter sp.]